MLGSDILSLREFLVREPLPLATIQGAVLEFLQGRDDVVVFGAQAVNAYVGEPRMTQNVDLLSPRAAALAEEVRAYLAGRFHIAVRVREVRAGEGYRVYQLRTGGNRHLVELRFVERLPDSRAIEGLRVLAPVELIASKVLAYQRRQGRPKSGTDWRDLALLLLTFPDLKQEDGPVAASLRASGADEPTMAAWRRLAQMAIEPEDDDY